MADRQTFRALEQTSLTDLRGADWDAYYVAMTPWLLDPDADIRKRAVNRLHLAVFSAEGYAASEARRALPKPAPWQPHDNSARTAWYLEMIEAAHASHRDVIPFALEHLRYGGGHAPDDPVMRWLMRLRDAPPPGVDPGMIEGTILLRSPFDPDDPADVARLVALLDHPSDHVRACAARTMSALDGAALDASDMFALISAKEIIRPGIAGAYWSEWSFCSEHVPVDPIAWMMNILERRSGPEPNDMPFNGIDFYLHEICDHAPEMVQRMIAGGHDELAIETATEMSDNVPGMEPVLRQLADHADSHIRRRAQFHLAHHYHVLHPEAETSGMIRRWPDWSPDADLFSFHHGEHRALWFVRLYPRREDDRFDDALAWSLIDRVLPPDQRGEVVFHQFDFGKVPPPGPYRLGNVMMWRFSSGATVDLQGDPDSGLWARIAIGGFGAGDRWKPFGDQASGNLTGGERPPRQAG
jgi:hypothetical protein